MPGQAPGVVLESLRDPGRHAGADGKQINVHWIGSVREPADGTILVGAVFNRDCFCRLIETRGRTRHMSPATVVETRRKYILVGSALASLPARVSPTVTELLRCMPAMMLRTGSTGIAVFALRLAGKDVESDI